MPAQPLQEQTTILIIEDDVTLGTAFAHVLRGAGYQVWLSHTAEDGIEKVVTVHPHVIIVDFRMPLVNGLGFLYRLRAAAVGRHTPVAVVTGDTTLDHDVKLQLQELDARLRLKPIMPNELLELVHSMLGESASHRETIKNAS